MRKQQKVAQRAAFRLSLLKENLALPPEEEPQKRVFEEKTRALSGC
jgi:hypothetical protein